MTAAAFRLVAPRLLASLLAVSTLPVHLAGQEADPRTEKLRSILTIQDLRSRRDATLRRLLYDRDTVVRTRAVLAYASIQDTAVLPDLVNNLVDGPPPAQEAAAFAIGQTAGSLRPPAVEELSHDLLWARLDRTSARARLIEELGKFGTQRTLTDLFLRLGTAGRRDRDPLTMAVARFAIRRITSPEGTRHALNALFEGDPDDWRPAYALQRIGDDPLLRAEAPRLIQALARAGPLARSNLAALFGKMTGDSTLIGPLVDLALFDADWRVRVNALKALATFPPDARIAGALGAAIDDGNASIVLTALTVLGGYGDRPGGTPDGIRPLLADVRALARGADRSHRWQYRAAAAAALAKLEGAGALPDLEVSESEEPLLTAGMISALGATGSPRALVPLRPWLDAADPLFRRAALEALHLIAKRHPASDSLADRAAAAYADALASTDMAVVTTAAANLGDSLFLRRAPVPALISALSRLRSPADIEAIQEVCRTLGKIGDASAAGALESVIDDGDEPAARAAAEALAAITGEDQSGLLAAEREPLHVDLDFGFIESLPETIAVRLETSLGDVLMEWYRDAAPFTIQALLKLAEREGFYRGLVFHRVVPNFVVQGGDPRGDGWGGPGYSVRSEFSALSYGSGTVGIASAGKDTEGSQFFITHSPQPHLDGRYTIIGRVVGGMDVVDGIQVGDRILDLGRTR